ncbi:MAG: translation initiation factor IF-2 N-terminal domain-containing protein, partial [Victivallales bacterium]|nr:translation initiation factor IF-2 N-terminal domain-containing protein [Victivallales bacterium]
MSDKVRVYDLARELGLTPKELIAMLEKEGFTVKSHSSTLEADIADLIRDAVITSRQKKQAAAAAAAAPKEKSAK